VIVQSKRVTCIKSSPVLSKVSKVTNKENIIYQSIKVNLFETKGPKLKNILNLYCSDTESSNFSTFDQIWIKGQAHNL
jgi:predicted nucleic acid binding AN1-type Zn finger protein